MRELMERATHEVAVLARNPAGARLGGVCTMLARRTGVDLTFLRIVVIVLALSGGLGVALYLCAWMLLPQRTASGTLQPIPLSQLIPAAQAWDVRSRLTATILIGLTTWVSLGGLTPFGAAPLLFALVCVVVVIHQRRRDAAARRSVADQHAARTAAQPVLDARATAFTSAVDAWQARVGQVAGLGSTGSPAPVAVTADGTGGWRDPAAASGAAWRSAPTQPVGVPAGAASPRSSGSTALPLPPGRRTSADRRLRGRRRVVTVVTLLLALASWWTVEQAHLQATPEHHQMLAISAALAVVALGLLIGTSVGRPRLLTPAAVALTLWLAALQVGAITSTGHWQSMVSGSGSSAAPYTYAGTRAVLDLPTSDASRTVHVRARASDITIHVPADVTVQVEYDLSASDLTVGAGHVSGTDAGTLTLQPSGAVDAGQASASPTSRGSGAGSTSATPPGARTMTITLSAAASRIRIDHG